MDEAAREPAGTEAPTPAEPAKPDSAPAAAPPAEPATTALAEEDETTLYGSLPADFWGEEDVASQTAPSAPPRPLAKARPTPARAEDRPAPDAASPLGADPATAVGTAFAELQELFPGRILEVVKDAPVAAAEGEPAEEPPDADLEGYDDPDQAPLSFGTSD